MAIRCRTLGKASLATWCAVALFGCSVTTPKDELFRKLVAEADDYQVHELLEAGQTLPIEATVAGLISEGFVISFAVLPDVDHQFCGELQVPIAGTARTREDRDAYALNRHADLFNPGYGILLYVNEECQVVRALGGKFTPNTL